LINQSSCTGEHVEMKWFSTTGTQTQDPLILHSVHSRTTFNVLTTRHGPPQIFLNQRDLVWELSVLLFSYEFLNVSLPFSMNYAHWMKTDDSIITFSTLLERPRGLFTESSHEWNNFHAFISPAVPGK
jgi:hypothetical protein